MEKRLSIPLEDNSPPSDQLEVPAQPWAAALIKERRAALAKDNPTARCLPSSLVRKDTASLPKKIVQTAGLIMVLYEADTMYRQIFVDGRNVAPDASPSWMGYSVGHWEGDTLVVETTGFNDKNWLTIGGEPQTETLRLIERFRRKDLGHMDVEITMDDPKAFTKPWTVTSRWELLPDTDLLEYVCERK